MKRSIPERRAGPRCATKKGSFPHPVHNTFVSAIPSFPGWHFAGNSPHICQGYIQELTGHRLKNTSFVTGNFLSHRFGFFQLWSAPQRGGGFYRGRKSPWKISELTAIDNMAFNCDTGKVFGFSGIKPGGNDHNGADALRHRPLEWR